MNLFKVTYDRWFRDRQQNWDFLQEEDFVFAENSEHAINMITRNHGKLTRPSSAQVRLATVDEKDRYLAIMED
jgi:phage anti-repressor protein